MKKLETIARRWSNRSIRVNYQILKKIPVIPIIIITMVTIPVVSCDIWLDVVPDNLPSLDDAFSNRATAEKSLFTCYAYLPVPISPFSYPTYFTNRDEFEYGANNAMYTRYAPQIARGEQNSNSPLLNYWSGGNDGINLFQAIRACNNFLDGIHQPRDMNSEYERKKWIAEVKFLKAYYHFFLLQLYGPIPIVKENKLISASSEEVKVFREPVDECVDYIVQLINEAVPDLPPVIANPIEEDGRITQSIALAVKAKALVWGASALFNGNPIYQDWRDSRGIQLVSPVYSNEKWEKARDAIRNAIDTCHLAGHKLYQYNRASGAQTYRMNDSLVLTMNTRKGITDKWNEGIIWSCMAAFDNYGATDNMQRLLFPLLYAQDAANFVGYCNASYNMAELFYTNNGIPIDEDIHWDYAGRYELRLSTNDAGNGYYIPINQQTVSLHFDREPRFYASLGFDRGFFELSTTTDNGGASFTHYLMLRQGEAGSSLHANLTGYTPKKLIAFESKGNLYAGYDYRFPIIRLADLYLLYSEALNEVKDRPDGEVYEWIDRVRAIAGLDGVVDSWKNSRYPNRPADKNEMRNIIRQERLIELAFEGQRFWDLRRWKLAENHWTYNPKGWNYMGKTAEEYYTLSQYDEGRKFTFKDYLWPISDYELRINPNLVQSYGW